MIVEIEKFGVLWTMRDAKTNTLYTIKDDSLYNSCKQWFMLVQDRNNKTQYLAFHNTSKIKDQIITHIRTSTYSQRQKLYEIDNISLNKNPNVPEKSKTDYDTIFDDKNLYAIPEQYIDIIGDIDPNMVELVEKFKEEKELNNQNIFVLSITADHIESTDTRFSMNNLSYGDYFKVIDTYFIKANGDIIRRDLFRGEKKISNQTMPRIAFQIFEKQISNMSDVDKKNFPVCKYSLNSKLFHGIYSSVEEYKKYRNSEEHMIYRYGENKQFVIYCWNIFSTIIFVKECLKRFGKQGDKFILSYTKKDKNEIESKQTESLKREDCTMKNKDKNIILYGPPGTGKTYSTVLKAMSIIDNKEYKDVSEEQYSALKTKFDELKHSGQIEFVTFHQSYSYEEFVEGIKPEISNWGEISKNLNYNGKDGVFKQICNRAENDLYAITKDAEIDFDKAYKLFQEKYEAGSNLLNLKNIRYEENNLVYHFGSQPGDRRIDLSKIKDIFNSNKKYETTTEFNRVYKGNNPLKGYFFNFYKELVKIKNDCDKENQDKNNINHNFRKYILIIDEINRGNISKIFGELITLIETDKRLGENYELQVSLPYSQESFGVPKNLYIIGTMNTSDRSIASIDIALRRRFKFVEMMPNSDLVADFECNFKEIFEKLNTKIKILLDRDHQIGHSYFINTKYNNSNGNNNVETLKDIWFSEILPLLNEYFYCDWEKLKLIIPGFIKKLDVPEMLKNECDDSIYEFKTFDEVSDFEKALNQEKFEQV